jgi:hypothetical protein
LLVLVAGLISLACILASCRRLALAIAPTAFDLDMLLAALAQPGSLEKLRAGLEPVACWEHELLDAACAELPAARGPLMDEQVVEADWSTERWMRAPRVGASVATSAGFLCASVILIQALGAGEVDLGNMGASGSNLSLALDALALGIVGTAFCVAVHVRAQVITRQRRVAVDRLVDRLRREPPNPAFPPSEWGEGAADARVNPPFPHSDGGKGRG